MNGEEHKVNGSKDIRALIGAQISAFIRDIGFPVAVAAYLLYMANGMISQALQNQVEVAKQLAIIANTLELVTARQQEILGLLREHNRLLSK